MRLTTLLLLLLSAAATPLRADAPAGALRTEDAVEATSAVGSEAFRGERGGEGASASALRLPARALDETERQRGGSGCLPPVASDPVPGPPSTAARRRLPDDVPAAARPRLLPLATGPPAPARSQTS